MTVTLRNVGVHCVAGWMTFAALISHGSAAQIQPKDAVEPVSNQQPAHTRSLVEGRWRQVEGASYGHELRLGTLEIAKCGEGYCGRLVKDGECGSVAMTLTADSGDVFSGDLKLGEKTFKIELTSAGQASGQLAVMATEGASFMSRSSMPLNADLVSQGAARCSPDPVS